MPAALAANPPTLFSMATSKAEVLAQGAQKAWPVKISEDNAFSAIFQGGMWLPNPAGGRIYVKYQRHVLHANGTWTWIGTVATVHGEQPAVLTFGKDGVFGLVPQASGYPLRIVTSHGQTRVIETNAQDMARSTQELRLHSHPDFVVPPRPPKGKQISTAAVRAEQQAAVQAAGTGTVTIDVMVAYTPGFVTELGSQSLALTRIQNLVDLTNQAYTASGINQQIRLVHTVEVNYPDNTSNDTTLDDLTGIDANGNPVTVPAAFQSIAALRVQYGADLVTLIRSYQNATQGDCGVGWLIGADETAIVPSQSNVYGYSVVSDGSNGGYYCVDTTFAHELGHNMGDAHDRANATQPGAYSYSYGYLGNGFSTIMAYGTATDTPLSLFSNPNISGCQNNPCGVADSASNSADNAHSMNNTAALIAAFEPTTVTTPPPTIPYAHNDINGDGKSDLLWYNSSLSQMTYWLMNGPTMTSWQALSLPNSYRPVATGDFNGDGRADILWVDANKNLYVWMNNGNGGFTSSHVTQYSGDWQVVGAADVNGDGKSDIFWYSPSIGELTYWVMNGPTMQSWRGFMVSNIYTPVGFGDFDGDGRADVLWTDTNGDLYMWLDDGKGAFTTHFITKYDYANWRVAGVADVDGDGDADIVWYSKTIGELTYWLMNGTTMRSWRGFMVSNAMWPVSMGDYNGDGRADILWAGTQDDLYMWLNDGAGGFKSNFIVHYTSDWAPVK